MTHGDIVGVLKIANPAFTATELEAQDLAAELIADDGAIPAGRRADTEYRGREVHDHNGFD